MQLRRTKLRSARPTLDEGRAFAHYLDQAAEGFIGFMLGRRAEDIVARAFIQADHDLSFQNVTFAELDGVIVGMISGYTAEQHRQSSNLPLKRAAGRWNLRMRVVSVLFAPLLRIIDSIADGDFYLHAVAVDSDLRGDGVGSALMDSLEDGAVAGGSARLVLDVTAENQGARRLYERRGMTVESRWPRRVALPKLKFLRMAKAL